MTRFLLRTGLLGGLGLLALQGCGGVCGDDGFEWQQSGLMACRPAATESATTSGSSTGVVDGTTGVPDPTLKYTYLITCRDTFLQEATLPIAVEVRLDRIPGDL